VGVLAVVPFSVWVSTPVLFVRLFWIVICLFVGLLPSCCVGLAISDELKGRLFRSIGWSIELN